jgi:hypothetical protein
MNEQIKKEILIALKKLGAPTHLLSIVGSIGDTLPDEIIIGMLQEYNENN